MTKSLIDYYGDGESEEPNTFSGLKNHWLERKKEETGINYQWSIKDQSLLSRLRKEYSDSVIVTLIDEHLRIHPTSTFGFFYQYRQDLYLANFKPTDYGYD